MQYIEDISFIHIPKTGGTFIERQLQFMNRDLFNNNRFFGGHFTYSMFKRKLKNIDSYNIFYVIRNPYCRIISAYFYLLNKVKNPTDAHIHEWRHLGSPSSLSELIINLYSQRNQIQGVHVIPQYKFVIKRNNKDLHKKNILKYENLQEDFNTFLMKYKKNISVHNYLHKNISLKIKPKKYNIKQYLSTQDIKYINEIYKEDFIQFNYEFQ